LLGRQARESRLGRAEGVLQGLPDEACVGNVARFRPRLQGLLLPPKQNRLEWGTQQEPGHAQVDRLVLLLEFKTRRLILSVENLIRICS